MMLTPRMLFADDFTKSENSSMKVLQQNNFLRGLRSIMSRELLYLGLCCV